MSQRLSDVIEQYVHAMKARGRAKNTIDTQRYALDGFLAYTGNIQVRHLRPRHFDDYFAHGRDRGLSNGTLNVQLNTLRVFIKYAQRQRFISDRDNPIAHYDEPFKVMPRDRMRIPAQDFGRVLDCAYHPRDRVLIALGLYLFLRASEVRLLRVSDLDLTDGEMHVAVPKTKMRDVMPICRDLDIELRRWLEYYQEDQGKELDPQWYLVPAHGAPHPTYDYETHRWSAGYNNRNLEPAKAILNAARSVRFVLERAGYPTRDEDGKPTGEGVHTLRRSGARALYDHLVSTGYDGALRKVQTMLHHKSASMTEHYIGMDLDLQSRNELLRGQWMFGTPLGGPNVLPLRKVKEQ